MGQFMRTVKGWKQEILSVWGRLRTFHRVALGITLGMAMVYASRMVLLDPLQAELAKKHKAMDEKQIPLVVPTAETDSEIQEAQIRLDSLRENAPQWQQRTDNVIRRKPQIDIKNRNAVLSEIEMILVRSGLALQSKSPYVPEAGPLRDKGKGKDNTAPGETVENQNNPLSIWAQQYEYSGTFLSVYNCLKQLGRFPYPARLHRIEIVTVQNNAWAVLLQGGEPLLLLRFNLELYFHDK